MGDLGDAIDEARAEVAESAGEFMPDRCSIYSGTGTETKDDFGDTSISETAIETDFPCDSEPMSAYERSTGGSVTAYAAHKLKLPATAASLAITGGYRLVYEPRGDMGERAFQVTDQMTGSKDLFVYLAATLKG